MEHVSPGASLHTSFDKAAASPLVALFARAGFITRGVIYILVGILSGLSAIGAGKGVRGSQGSLDAVLDAPFGKAVLFAAVIGFSAFAVSYFIRAFRTPHRSESIFVRGSWLYSSLIYTGVVVSAIRILLNEQHENATRQGSTWVISHPLGRWILACIGLGIAGFALFELWRGIAGKISERIRLRELSKRMCAVLLTIGRIGIVARGIVFLIIGIFLILAGWFNDPHEARTLGGALRFVEREPYGPWLLGIVAVGLIAFGLFQFTEARYRRMD